MLLLILVLNVLRLDELRVSIESSFHSQPQTARRSYSIVVSLYVKYEDHQHCAMDKMRYFPRLAVRVNKGIQGKGHLDFIQKGQFMFVSP